MVLLDFLARVALWVLTHTLYRIRIGGKEHVPVRGPALLVCNHLSHIDGLLVGACIPRSVRFSVFKTYSRDAALNWLMRPLNAIPVGDGGEALASVERARDALRQGHVVCIFAEGAISRTGNLLPFASGFERIADGLDVPVIPVYLDQVWGSVFSFKNGRFFWKRPTRVPYRVTLTFGAPLPSTATAQDVRQAVLELGADAVGRRIGRGDLLHLRFLETVMKEMTPAHKFGVLLAGLLLPARVIEWLFVDGDRNADGLATVIFSSGSTGMPKGVMLSHRNVLANIEGMAQIYWVADDDCLMGVLPFFHSFGFTGSIWLPLVSGFGVVYHANPMDAGTIGEMVRKHRATMIISTPSFCLGYVRKCTAEEFATLRYAVVGAEKLREPIARAFKEKFGLDLLEGYGCTEMSPAVALNAPDYPAAGQKGMKPGTVGHPLPGVAAKVVDRDTGQPMKPGAEGLLLVKGANLMLGYLNAPEKTRDVLRDGWYVTGDIATIDEDGFIRLTDRLSRFSKIAGEMVPHLKIEETITEILGDSACVVTAIPDESKGERLVAFYSVKEVTPETLWSRLSESSLPRLWIPKRDNLYYLDPIPMLGSGKVDLKKVRELAVRYQAVGKVDTAREAQNHRPQSHGDTEKA